jgi:hypothetical protein
MHSGIMVLMHIYIYIYEEYVVKITVRTFLLKKVWCAHEIVKIVITVVVQV